MCSFERSHSTKSFLQETFSSHAVRWNCDSIGLNAGGTLCTFQQEVLSSGVT
eukprot:m.179415 g.179415  ORF g.179415 m.179415 type:complete len:52 (+) comp15476_c0_seq7:251-406(+)